jgi:hypothetical protein
MNIHHVPHVGCSLSLRRIFPFTDLRSLINESYLLTWLWHFSIGRFEKQKMSRGGNELEESYITLKLAEHIN